MKRLLLDLPVLLVLVLAVNTAAVMLPRIGSVVLKDTYRSIFRYQMALCGVLLLAALDLRFGFLTALSAPALRVFGWVLRVLLIACTGVILYFCGRVLVGCIVNTAAPAEHALVLGMALEDGKATKDLVYRLDTAKEYLDQNPDTVLVLTGGNREASGLTEADVMRQLLAERGVPEEKMILEDKAATTEENFKNTLSMMDPEEPVVLITSNTHMDRAAAEAERAGFGKVLHLPAPSEPVRFAASLMWEVVLDLNSLVKTGH